MIGIGLGNYRGWEVPWSAMCKLENQKSQWHHSGLSSRSISDQEQERIDAPVEAKRKFSHSLHFCSTQALNGPEDTHLHWWGWSSILNLPTLKTNLLVNIFPHIPRYNVWPAIWAFFERKGKVKVLVAQSCLTLCDPVDCSSPGSPVHGIFPGNNTGVVTISFSMGSSQHRNWTQVSCIAADSLPSEPPGKPLDQPNWLIRLALYLFVK